MSLILVVDDRETDRDLLRTVLGYGGHDVVEARDGAQALDLARTERPDVVITDLMMPNINGIELLRELRDDEHLCNLPVIFCTATWSEDEISQIARAGAVARFVPKPCEPMVLLEAVAEAVGSPVAITHPPEPASAYDREQLRLLNDKLMQKVAELEIANAARGRLLGLLLQAQEDECARIAEDIHDDTMQAIVGLGMRLDLLVPRAGDGEVGDALAKLRDQTAETGRRLRLLLADLKPRELDEDGLIAALEPRIDELREDGVEVTVHSALRGDPGRDTALLLFRAAQEALANVRKHASAANVAIEIGPDKAGASLTVRDDGCGIPEGALEDVRPGHLGLTALRERLELAGGRLSVHGQAGAGTTLEAWVPLEMTSP